MAEVVRQASKTAAAAGARLYPPGRSPREIEIGIDQMEPKKRDRRELLRMMRGGLQAGLAPAPLDDNSRIALAEMARANYHPSSLLTKEQAIAWSDDAYQARNALAEAGRALVKPVPAQVTSDRLPGAGFREAQESSMSAMYAHANELPHELEDAFKSGGKAAVDQVIEGMHQAGQGAGEAFNRSTEPEAIGARIAAGFNANVRIPNVSIPAGGTLSGRAVGRSMPFAGTPASGAEGGRATGPGGNGGV